MTAQDVLVEYIDKMYHKMGITVFAGHVIETEVPDFGRSMFNKLHTPGTYSREFRKLKNSTKLQKDKGLKITEETVQGSKENYYKISII